MHILLEMCISYLENASLLKYASHHMSFQWAVIFLLLEGLALIFDYGLLIRVVVAEVWGWLWQFLKIRLVLHVCTQSCQTLWDAMDYSLPGSSVHGIFRQEYWSGLPFPPPGDLLKSGIKFTSPARPALQADSLLLSHQGSRSEVCHINWLFLSGTISL